MAAYLRQDFCQIQSLEGGISNVFKFLRIQNMKMFNHVTQGKCQKSWLLMWLEK